MIRALIATALATSVVVGAGTYTVTTAFSDARTVEVVGLDDAIARLEIRLAELPTMIAEANTAEDQRRRTEAGKRIGGLSSPRSDQKW